MAYHGIKVEFVKSIVEHKRIMFSGDILNNGKILPLLNGNFFGGFSHSIKYAIHDFYTRLYQFNGRIVKVVIQWRIKPKSFKKFRETVRAKNKIDINISNEEIEWVTHDKLAVISFCLLIGVF